MADLVGVIMERGRAAWPEVALSSDAIARHLGPHASEEPPFLADLYLALACAEGIPSAVAAFEQQLTDWLRTPQGRFATYYAARQRLIAA